MALPPMVQRMVDFLRAGYPDGVPERDYLPLFALLGRHLTEDEVVVVAAELAASHALPGGTGPEAVHRAIEAVTKSPALETDVQRVRDRLEAAGWRPGG